MQFTYVIFGCQMKRYIILLIVCYSSSQAMYYTPTRLTIINKLGQDLYLEWHYDEESLDSRKIVPPSTSIPDRSFHVLRTTNIIKIFFYSLSLTSKIGSIDITQVQRGQDNTLVILPDDLDYIQQWIVDAPPPFKSLVSSKSLDSPDNRASMARKKIRQHIVKREYETKSKKELDGLKSYK